MVPLTPDATGFRSAYDLPLGDEHRDEFSADVIQPNLVGAADVLVTASTAAETRVVRTGVGELPPNVRAALKRRWALKDDSVPYQWSHSNGPQIATFGINFSRSASN